jgi:hypothetical protein
MSLAIKHNLIVVWLKSVYRFEQINDLSGMFVSLTGTMREAYAQMEKEQKEEVMKMYYKLVSYNETYRKNDHMISVNHNFWLLLNKFQIKLMEIMTDKGMLITKKEMSMLDL